MRLSLRGLAFAGAILWGGAILFVGIINLMDPAYGLSFLHGLSSVYPGYHAARTVPSVILGTVEGLIDGGVAGFIVAWLYNSFAVRHAAYEKGAPVESAAH